MRWRARANRPSDTAAVSRRSGVCGRIQRCERLIINPWENIANRPNRKCNELGTNDSTRVSIRVRERCARKSFYAQMANLSWRARVPISYIIAYAGCFIIDRLYPGLISQHVSSPLQLATNREQGNSRVGRAGQWKNWRISNARDIAVRLFGPVAVLWQ